MAEVKEHPAGAPCWVDVSSSDIEASRRFYGSLFGWETQTVEGGGGYTMCTLRGSYVAGIGPLMDPGQPPAWATYVSVDDVEAALGRVDEAGGKVLAGPMDVMAAGRMAVVADRSGAAVSLWQAGEHPGAGLVNEAGTLCWNELSTPDPDGAVAFYGPVFGWGARSSPMGEVSYTEWQLGERSVAGMMPSRAGDGVPPHWLVYFGADDCDAATATAETLGAAVRVPATDFPGGRFSVLADPLGAGFGLLRMSAGG